MTELSFKLPIDSTKHVLDTATISFVVPSKDPEKPHFAITINAKTEEEAERVFLASLKANEIGYDELTRTTKWQ